MHDSWNPHRDALVETCDKPACEYCGLGSRLVAALNEARVSPPVELLTLVRILAATLAATVSNGERYKAIEAVIEQLRDDTQMLSQAQKESWH
jgi:hypothetical protein